MAGSRQHDLDTLRKPRVHITYDVETGGAIQKTELPLVVGVLADLSGANADAKSPLKQRKFVEIDADTFSDVMAGISPTLSLNLPDHTSATEGTKTAFDLSFNSMEAFHPDYLVANIPALKALLDKRTYLNELLVKLDGNDKLDEKLLKYLSDPNSAKELHDESQKMLPPSTAPAPDAQGGN